MLAGLLPAAWLGKPRAVPTVPVTRVALHGARYLRPVVTVTGDTQALEITASDGAGNSWPVQIKHDEATAGKTNPAWLIRGRGSAKP